MPSEDPPDSTQANTQTGGKSSGAVAATVFRLHVRVTEGVATGQTWESTSDHGVVGSHASCDLILEDPTVSRFHCELRLYPDGARIRDLGSKNGTVVDGVRVVEAYLRGGALVRLGRSVLRFDFGEETNQMPVSARTSFGSLVGEALPMRRAFALLERAAESNVTVLIEGETGTGKEGAAAAIHEHSARRDGPFMVLDCSAIPKELLESELFGHEKGSFTGASGRRVGAFEEASGGTIFLDEIGELSLDLQPKLLRALEQREIRRVGSNSYVPIDVRVLAATNRDLRVEVNEGRFRSDVYYRLAVLKIPLPSLRERPEDFGLLIRNILTSLKADQESIDSFTSAEFIAQLQAGPWPGNVRELRNHIERCLVMRAPLAVEAALGGTAQLSSDGHVPYDQARQRANHDFEKRYLESLLSIHQGNVARAAKAAGISRVYLYRLMRRSGVG